MATTDQQYEDQRFLILRRYRDMPDAFLYGSILDSAAIECFLGDENMIRMDWLWSNFLGGFKLNVRRADTAEAASLLDQSVPEKFDVEGVGEYQQPCCPNCQSLNVSFQGGNKPVDYMRALFGGPVRLHLSIWECGSCGDQWPESDQKPSASLLISVSSILLIVWLFGNISALVLSTIWAVRLVASR